MRKSHVGKSGYSPFLVVLKTQEDWINLSKPQWELSPSIMPGFTTSISGANTEGLTQKVFSQARPQKKIQKEAGPLQLRAFN